MKKDETKIVWLTTDKPLLPPNVELTKRSKQHSYFMSDKIYW